MLAKVYINLLDQREPTLNFNNANEQKKTIKNTEINYFKKVIKPNLEEIRKHDSYLKENLKKNNFN